jgi:uncharacterized protein
LCKGFFYGIAKQDETLKKRTQGGNMGTIQEIEKGGSDRTVGDRQRHREKVRKAIQDNIADIISEEGIVGKDRGKIVKVPIRGIREYRFIFGKNQKGVGTGAGDNNDRGDEVGRDKKPGDAKAGDQEGEDYYETEVQLEELIDIMFEDLELPNFEKKQLHEVPMKTKHKRLGKRKKGPRNKLLPRDTQKQHIRTIKAHVRGIDALKKEIGTLRAMGREFEAQECEDRLSAREQELKDLREMRSLEPKPGWVPIREDDLIYSRTRIKMKPESNAVVFCLMDTSGSMDTIKKYLARVFFFLLYRFIETKYERAELVFIAHTVVAKEVTEDEFFYKGESGGTFISSAYKLALEIIADRYHPSLWNVYAFHCSDGDNWDSDNDNSVKLIRDLCAITQLVGYGEIKPSSSYSGSSMVERYKEQVAPYHDNFAIVQIGQKEDVWPQFKELMSKSKDKGVQL